MKYYFHNSIIFLLSLPLVLSAHGGVHPEMDVAGWYVPYIIPVSAVALGLLAGGFLYFRMHSMKLALTYGVALMLMTFMAIRIVFPDMEQMHHMSTIEPVQLSREEQILKGVHAEVYRSPGCGCCGGYVQGLKDVGAEVVVHEVTDAKLSKLKNTKGIPADMYSCHTSIIDGYVVEGHVPFAAVAKLVSEKPTTTGIALPGMPIGTPGMPGKKQETFEIMTLTGEEFMRI